MYVQTGAPLYNKDTISLIAKKKKKKNALPTWKNLDGWTLNKQFFLFGLSKKLFVFSSCLPELVLIINCSLIWAVLDWQFL